MPMTSEGAGYKAVAKLYNALMTGLVLSLVSRKGGEDARRFVFAHFRRQHLEKFLPGLKKLGLDRLPDAVACAQYHYFSNALGGVKTQYVAESPRKAWVRYPPPRWIWQGTAICAIPREVNEAMLHGWHGHNGVSLGNPRLGFVCTGQTVEGARASKVTISNTTATSAKTSGCVSQPASACRASIPPPRPGSTSRAGPRTGCARSSAPTRWNMCARCCPRCR